MSEPRPQVELTREYRFEAAHRLPRVPEGHRCRRVHGHSYQVTVVVEGPVDPHTGWVVDFADVEAAWRGVHDALDHRCLNDVPGLENPTSERLAEWCWRALAPALPLLAAIEVRESGRFGCRLRRADVTS